MTLTETNQSQDPKKKLLLTFRIAEDKFRMLRTSRESQLNTVNAALLQTEEISVNLAQGKCKSLSKMHPLLYSQVKSVT